MFFLPRTFRTQLALGVALLVAALAVSLSVVLGELTARASRHDEGVALYAVARSTARALADGLAQREREVRVMAESPTLWSDGLDALRVAQVFHRSQAVNPLHAWIGVADAAGVVRNATGALLVGSNVSQRPWFSAGLRALHVADVHPAQLLARLLPPGSDGGPLRFVDFAAPIPGADGRPAGVVVIHGSWEWAHATVESLLPESAAARGLEVFIFDRDGVPIYAPGSSLEPLRQAGQTLPLRAGDRLDHATAPEPAQALEWRDGAAYLTAAARLPAQSADVDLGWTVVARLPVAVAYASARREAALALGLGLLAALVASVLGAMMATRLTRPLRRLAQAARAINAGENEAPMPRLHGNAEMEQLSETLAAMTQHLVQANVRLEQRVAERTAALERVNAELAQLARHDPLTGLLNRRGLDDRLPDLIAHARRRATPVALLVVDADHFKRINDRFGHDAGDDVLKVLALQLRQRLRAVDLVARVGGEEFVVVLPDTDVDGARGVAASLVARIAALQLPQVGEVTVSVGGTVLRSHDEPLQQALKRADIALYQAKNGGRNRFEFVAVELTPLEITAQPRAH